MSSAPLDLEQFAGFTPGPLESPGTDGDARVICHHDGHKRRTLAHVYGGRKDADANLYAAAPALLEECRRQREEIARLRAALDECLPALQLADSALSLDGKGFVREGRAVSMALGTVRDAYWKAEAARAALQPTGVDA